MIKLNRHWSWVMGERLPQTQNKTNSCAFLWDVLYVAQAQKGRQSDCLGCWWRRWSIPLVSPVTSRAVFLTIFQFQWSVCLFFEDSVPRKKTPKSHIDMIFPILVIPPMFWWCSVVLPPGFSRGNMKMYFIFCHFLTLILPRGIIYSIQEAIYHSRVNVMAADSRPTKWNMVCVSIILN